jgi:hypothetical protein
MSRFNLAKLDLESGNTRMIILIAYPPYGMFNEFF